MRTRWLAIVLVAASASAAPADDPKRLLATAQALEHDGAWAEARAAYRRLEGDAQLGGRALYGEAWAAFQDGDTPAAMELAIKAAARTGPYRVDAQLLYGDTLFKSGEPARAKAIYLAVRDTLTGERRELVARKVVACNRALQLALDDGLPAAPRVAAKPAIEPGDGLYAQAKAAFDGDDLDVALVLATKAIRANGAHRTDAQVLYGDVLFRRGEFRRAKDVYLVLRARVPAALRAAVTRKAIACNRKLALPDHDAIDD